jgi:hypothetical protein
MRFDNNGWFDPTFNNGRTVETGFGGMDAGSDVVQSTNGGLIVGGSVNGKLALAAYTPAGQLDSGFGTGGRFVLDAGDVSHAYSHVGLANAPGNRLVIAGGTGSTTARLLDYGAIVVRPDLGGFRPGASRIFSQIQI